MSSHPPDESFLSDLELMLEPRLWPFKHPRARGSTVPVLPLRQFPGPRLGFLVYDEAEQHRPWRFHDGNVLAVEDSPGQGTAGGPQLLRSLVVAGWVVD